jgi:hypothetical protein
MVIREGTAVFELLASKDEGAMVKIQVYDGKDGGQGGGSEASMMKTEESRG